MRKFAPDANGYEKRGARLGYRRVFLYNTYENYLKKPGGCQF